MDTPSNLPDWRPPPPGKVRKPGPLTATPPEETPAVEAAEPAVGMNGRKRKPKAEP